MIESATAWGVSVGRLPSTLCAIAITADDERVVGASAATSAVWAARHGGRLAELPGARGLELVPARAGEATTWVALAGEGVRVVQLDGLAALELEGGEGWSVPLGCSPDGRWLAATAAAEVAIWDLRSGRLAARLAGAGRAPVASLAWMPGPYLLLTRRLDPGGAPSAIERWSLGPPPREERLPSARQADAALVAASADGERFAVAASKDADLLLYDGSGQLRATLVSGEEGTVCAARFSPDGHRLALLKPASISLWRAADGARLAQLTDLPRRGSGALAFLHRRATLLLDDGDGYQFVDVEEGRWARAAAGPDALQRYAEALAEGLASSETHEANYRTAATGVAERQPDGAWCFETQEAGITLRARVRDGDAGAVHLVLRAHAGGTLGDWADEHHVYAADLSWARKLLDLPPGASFSVLRGFRRLALEVGLDCAPPADTVRAWLGALGARCRALG